MKVIFLKDVPRIGKRNDIKEVNAGYAANFLIPRKLAKLATPKAVKELELQKKEVLIEKKVQADLLQKNLDEIKGKTITMKMKADPKGHLFKAVHPKDIVKAMQKQNRAQIDEKCIILEGQIKAIGEFEIPISVNDKKSSFKLIIEEE